MIKKALQTKMIKTENGGEIHITLFVNIYSEDKQEYTAEVDGVEWFGTESFMHATVLFNLMKAHISDYMHYRSIEKGEAET